MPSAAGTDGDLELFDQGALVLLGADAVVEGFVHLQGRAFADLVGGRVVFVHGVGP